MTRFWGAMVGVALVFAATGCADEGCEDAGRTYESGDVWTCSDGCNGCSCSDGTVTSTLIGCPSPPGPAAGKLSCEGKDGYWHPHGETWNCDSASAECTCSDGEIVRG